LDSPTVIKVIEYLIKLREGSGKIDDIDLDSGEVRVLGKGSKERIAFLGSHAKEALREYLKIRKKFLKARLCLLLLVYHSPSSPDSLTGYQHRHLNQLVSQIPRRDNTRDVLPCISDESIRYCRWGVPNIIYWS
jgi:site-specific recombinase XerD